MSFLTTLIDFLASKIDFFRQAFQFVGIKMRCVNSIKINVVNNIYAFVQTQEAKTEKSCP